MKAIENKIACKKEETTLSKCCNTCPFLQENADKPNPEGWVPNKEQGFTDWYTQDNLNNLWKNGLAHGEPMVCHTHDPNAGNYGGKNASHDRPKLCMGAVMTQFKHIKRYEELLNKAPEKGGVRKAYSAYKKEFGRLAMSLEGLQKIGWWFAMGRTDLIGGLPVPRSSDEERPFREINL